MFKKLCLIATFAILPFCAQSQEKESNDKPSKFGFTAGFINSEFEKSRFNYAADDYFDPLPGLGGSGFFLGLTFDTEFNVNFGLSSEFLYANISGSDQLRLASLLKYNLFNSNFHLLAGPEINFLTTRALDHDSVDYGNEFGFNLTAGLEYDINRRISVYAKYSFELTDRYKSGTFEDYYKGGFDGFRLGLKFKF